jgi:hypothetical protein
MLCVNRPWAADTLWPYYYYSQYPASLSHHQSPRHNTPHHTDTTQQPCEDVPITSIILHGAQFKKQNTYTTASHYTSTWRLRTIIILNVLGLGLSYRMLSGDPILSILLGGRHPFFHRVDTVVPVMVGGCFPFCLRAAVPFVGTFCSHVSPRHRPFLLHRRYPCSTSGP